MVGEINNMKVLSLFDGMSCCRLALEKLDISVEKYYASEIDKYAIEVTQANFPDTKQLGDVTAWQTWELDWASIDLVTGGFPCQAWSLAGKQLGDKDERGKLFWTMLDVMAKVMAHNPKAFYLMENVKMKKEFETYITYHTEQALPNVYKYLINSALVSAQSRQRYYWTNIPGVEQPEDKGIVLKDILEDDGQADLVGNGGREAFKKNIQKGTPLLARDWKGWNTYGMTGVQTSTSPIKAYDIPREILKDNERQRRVYDPSGKSPSILGRSDSPKVNKPKQVNPSKKAGGKQPYMQDRVFHEDGKSHSLTASFANRTNVATKPKQVGKTDTPGHDILKRVYSEDGKSPAITAHAGKGTVPKIETKPKQVGIAADINGHDILKRVYSPEGKSPTLNAHGGGNTEPKVVSGALRARSKNQDGKNVGWKETKPEQMLELRKDEKANSVSSVSKDSLVVSKKVNLKKYNDEIAINPRNFGGKGYIGTDKKSVALTQPSGNNATLVRAKEEDLTWRKLTPNECMALQTVRSDYLMPVSNTQKYKLLGNGWTVDVIVHIFTFMQRAHNGEHLVTKGQQSLDL